MAFSFNQATFTQSGVGPTLALAYTTNVTAGSVLVAILTGRATGMLPSSVSDTQGNVWVQVGTSQFGGVTRSGVFVCLSAKTTGANTVTGTWSTSGAAVSIGIAEWLTAGVVVTLDTSGQATAASTPATSQSITASMTKPNDLIIFVDDIPNGQADTVTAGSSLTKNFFATTANSPVGFFSKIVTASGSVTGSVTTSNARDYNAWMFGISPPLTKVPNSLMMMGAGT